MIKKLLLSFFLLFIGLSSSSAFTGVEIDSSKVSRGNIKVADSSFLHHKKMIDVSHLNRAYTNYLSAKKTKDVKKVISTRYRTFPSLDKSQKSEHFSHSFQKAEPEFTANFLAENFPKDREIDSLKNKVDALINEIEDLGKFVDVITKDRLVEFPIGLKTKDDGGSNVSLVISEVQMHPKYAELKMFAKLSIPQQGIDLFFGAEKVKFSHSGAFVGDTKLVLLGDQPIPFNGNNWLLTLKGSYNSETGAFGDQSFVTVNCNGIEEISLEADLRVSRNVLLPIDNQGNYVCGESNEDQFELDENEQPTTTLNSNCYVGSSFSVKATGWNDLLVEIDLPQFEVNGFKGWGFTLEGAVLDLSDTRNSPNVTFPEVYQRMYTGEQANLWRGVYASSVKVTLPKAFAKNGNERTEFGAKDLLLDTNGVSGEFYGNNLIKAGEGNANKWPFTLDSLAFTLEVNKLKGGALAGTIQVPVLDKPFDYKGYMTSKAYGLKVITKETINAPLFLAEMQLEPNSSVEIKVEDDGIYPSANLTGSLKIKANIGQKDVSETLKPAGNEGGKQQNEKTDFELPGIAFEELKINTEPGTRPIEVSKFEFTGENELFNFPVTINNLKFLSPSSIQAGLGMDLTINLDKNGSGATSKLAILGKLEELKNVEAWSFDTVNMDGIAINVDRSGVKIAGGLEIMKEDPTYGNGFSGDLQVDITKLNIQANAKAMFGNKNFRYWFVDVWSDNTKGGDGKLAIEKFVGGMSYAMKQTSADSNWTPSESTYIPYKANGLSLKAGIAIATKSKAFQGKAFLEMDFNRDGGLNRIGFTGDGSMMLAKQSGAAGGASDSAKGKLKDIGDKINKFVENNQDKVEKYTSGGNYLAISKDAIPKGEVAAEGNIGVYVGIEKDFTTDTFHGEFEVYVDLMQLKGASDKENPNNTLAGRAVIHTSPDKWYLHLGTPKTPMSLAFMVPPETFTVNAYFMTGNVMPTQITPHPRVLEILGNDIMDGNRSSGDLTAGRGFAFGLSFEYRKDFRASIFYAFLEAGIGFDVMHREYPGASCVGRSGPLGNNGWYSLGQVYAYLYGEAGVRVKLFGKTKSFKVLEAGIAAMLRGQFPNPSYFEGYVGAYYSVMGGLISGRMRLHVDYGEKCVIQRGADDGLEVPIISDTYPVDKDKDIDVFISPQIVFNYAIDRAVTITESTGDTRYKIDLREAKLLVDGVEIPTTIDWDSAKTEATFNLMNELLPSEKEVVIRAKVTFQEWVDGAWKAVTSGGKEVNETKEISFRTSKAPDYIPLQNVEYMYPVKDQNYFFPEEFNQGYVQLDKNQAYLFDSSYNYKAQLTSSFGEITRSDLKYDQGKRRLYYTMPSSQTSSNYKFDVMVYPKADEISDYVKPPAEEMVLDQENEVDDSWFTDASNTKVVGSTAATAKVAGKSATRVINAGESKSLLDYSFSSSKYATFKDKMRSIEPTIHNTEIISSDVQFIHTKQVNNEPFELFDLIGDKYTGNIPLIKGNPVLEDNYYKKRIKPISYDFTSGIDANGFSLIPAIKNNFRVNTFYINYLNLNLNDSFLRDRNPFVYDMASKYKKDFLATRNYIVNAFDKNNDEAFFERNSNIINAFFPNISLGTYKSTFTYTLPGGLYSYTYKTIKYVND